MHEIISHIAEYGLAVYLCQSIAITLISQYEITLLGEVKDFILITLVSAFIVHWIYEKKIVGRFVKVK